MTGCQLDLFVLVLDSTQPNQQFVNCATAETKPLSCTATPYRTVLGLVSLRFDDLVDPKNQGIAYPTGNPDLLITGDPLFYTNLLATLV